MLGLIEAHGDPVREQVAQGHDLLTRVLQRGHHAEPDRAALGGQGGEGGFDPVPELLVGLVGGQEGDLIDQDHDQRVRGCRRVLAAGPGVGGGAGLHLGDRVVEHGRDGFGEERTKLGRQR